MRATATVACAEAVAEKVGRTRSVVRHTGDATRDIRVESRRTAKTHGAGHKRVARRARWARHAARCAVEWKAAEAGRTAAATGEGTVVKLCERAVTRGAAKVGGACARGARLAASVADVACDVGVVDEVAYAGGGADVGAAGGGEGERGAGFASGVREGAELEIFGAAEAGSVGGVDGVRASDAGGAGEGSGTDAIGELGAGAADLRGLSGDDGAIGTEGTGEAAEWGGEGVVRAARAREAGSIVGEGDVAGRTRRGKGKDRRG